MLLKMLTFELRYFVRQPSFYVSSLLFFLLAFFATVSDKVQIGGSNVNANSPYTILMMMVVLLIFALFAVVNFVASSTIRNDSEQMAELVYSKPIAQRSYHLGRFLGAFCVTLLVFAFVPLGIFLGTWFGSLMGWLDPELLAPNKLQYYLQPFVILAVPTLLVMAVSCHVAALRFRTMMAVYIAAVVLFIGYNVVSVFFEQPEFRLWAALFDPFGFGAFMDATRYWTVAEKDTQTLALEGNVLYNRLIWLSVAVVLFVTMGLKGGYQSGGKDKKPQQASASMLKRAQQALSNKIAVRPAQISTKSQFLLRTRFEIVQVVFSAPFMILAALTLFMLISPLLVPGQWYGTSNWPLTQAMIPLIKGVMGMFMIIILVYYSAEVVWRERNSNFGDIIDSYPTHNLVFWASKLLAITTVLVLLYGAGMLFTITYQLVKGQFNIELSQYLFRLGYLTMVPLVMTTILAFFFQVISPNKYVGMLLFIIYYAVNMVLSNYGFSHNMYRFASSPAAPYSDLNTYGHFLTAVHWYNLYWLGLTLVLAALGYGLWHRGPQQTLLSRLRLLGYHLGNKGKLVATCGLVIFVASGSWIYHNTRVLNDYLTEDQLDDLRAQYEQQLVQYKDAPIPVITKVDVTADIYPHERRMVAKAEVEFTNTSEQSISRFLVFKPRYASQWQLSLDGGRLGEEISGLYSWWYEFDTPLQPGETRTGEMSVVREHQGFKDSRFDTQLVENGTFIDNYALFPVFGYQTDNQLTDRNERRKRGLPELERAHDLKDSRYYQQSFFGQGVGFIEFSATISTSLDQFAIAPGYLQHEEVDEERGRRTFRYEMDAPMVHFYNIMSAQLEVKKEQYKGIDIEVYYHRDHAWNIDTMIQATKDSIDYFTQAFGPYQHKQLRILEFPGYRSFAQSFANTVPYSENIGFITDLRDPDDINAPYYVTAHEVAHQWWGHQVGAANVQGSAVISETLSQYSAIQVLREKYGEQKLRKFLKFELDRYLQGRTREAHEEMPLYRSENQQYLHYLKGSVVMMAVADRIGVERTNEALKAFLQAFKYKDDPYPTTLDLLSYLKADADEQEQAFIDDQFKRITLFELGVEKVEVAEQADADGKFKVTLTVTAKKAFADGKGNETEQPMAQLVDIGLFSDDPEKLSAEDAVIYLQKHQLTSGENTLELYVDKKPSYAGVDPLVKLVDRDSANNIKKL
ncbi:ABC transporter permease/M1 family aminopeptidase [Pseudoalteromonas sp. T1lg75]|uniref:ABC transporter permease/M1 family aminopeptidase n=1 Tax=Pseudoalteromonas sp. T1lg75 TaxID=2077102 RepID=UPI000CF661D9|nr:M1 family aminopeptidase [Pseudoalteromonas sp. T1lg75]